MDPKTSPSSNSSPAADHQNLESVAVAMNFVVKALVRELEIDPETTEFRFRAKGEEIAVVNLAQLLARADALLGAA